MNKLGKLLKELRGKESLREASKRIGISHTYLDTIEKGKDKRTGAPVKPTPETLKLISQAYNYSYMDLLTVAGYIDRQPFYINCYNPDEDPSGNHTLYPTANPSGKIPKGTIVTGYGIPLARIPNDMNVEELITYLADNYELKELNDEFVTFYMTEKLINKIKSLKNSMNKEFEELLSDPKTNLMFKDWRNMTDEQRDEALNMIKYIKYKGSRKD
ncbi:helix-turn-helix domain-containing protein [Lentibacillus sp. Marseille-P4043]|uniref:helix-turn-helix domain-containing protein n=1 Tax=Lentibacillus sp. Marseille-P4043 TaxID=2040293 RepID=UPI000D0B8D73|nr:helix-turn-helix transcriptional regulator [Lentibacillus sp. Marseille-P4043]